MNETQAEELSEELFKRFEHVKMRMDDDSNYEVIVSGRVKAVPPSRSCDSCRNRVICLVNQRLTEIMPIIAIATFNMKIADHMKKVLGTECERFVR